MAWIESHQSLGTHRKLMKLMRELHISDARAVGHLHFLWWWALDNTPSGDLSALTADDVAVAAHWPKEAGGFFTALIDAGWIDDEGSGKLSLHDWEKYAGRLARQRALTLDQRRNGGLKRMSSLDAQGRRELALRAADARWHTGPQAIMPATVPNSTVPNRSKETDKEKTRTVGDGVVMTDGQLKLLTTRFGEEGARQRIERLSLYKLSTGKKYKSDYHTVLNWERMSFGGVDGHRIDGNHSRNPRSLVPRSEYTRPEALRHNSTGTAPDPGTGPVAADASGDQS